MKPPFEHPKDIPALLRQVERPKRAIVTGGMPYANGPLHLGHLAGAQVPPDIYARWLRMLIGKDRVLFVCGNDDHGSVSELAALKAGIPTREFIDSIHAQQQKTVAAYSISFDVFSGTSRPECYPLHVAKAQDFLRRLYRNGMLEKRRSRQWFDPKLNRFLQDRFVQGRCPNTKCDNDGAYGNECDRCGMQYEADELVSPRSTLSDATPELRETVHWWLDMWKVAEVMRVWIQGKEKTWRRAVFNEVINTILPSLSFDNVHEAKYKESKDTLPKHKSKYAPGKKVQLQFESRADMDRCRAQLDAQQIPTELMNGWAHRSITRDVSWGIPVPPELDPEMVGKTLYVWPDSLIAPISFTEVALHAQGRDGRLVDEFWRDKDARIYQFLGQDNVYFYVLMQGAMWIGTQADITRLPVQGEWQLTDVFGCYHLLVDGDKMSKSRGNFYTADQLLSEKGYHPDQLRYYLAMLGLPDKASNFEFANFEERNKFLAGPMNAAFEKPIAACHSKFGGVIPEGNIIDKVEQETFKIVQKYLRCMERAEYVTLLGQIENYARQINSLFTQFKPHDDRFPEAERRDALYSCFYVLKTLMIMLHPFVPSTMDKLRQSLRLADNVFNVDELGKPMLAGHQIGEQLEYFPPVL